MKLASECCLPLLFMLPSLFVCVPLVLHLTVMSYFQLTALPSLYSSLLYRFIHRKKKSEAESHFSGLLRWVKNISTRGNNLNGFRGSQAVWGSELAMQSRSGTAGMTQSSALDQHCPDQGPSFRATQTLHVLQRGEEVSFAQSASLLAAFSAGHYLEKSDVS